MVEAGGEEVVRTADEDGGGIKCVGKGKAKKRKG